MAAELTATVKASISWSYVKAVTGLSTDSENANTLSYSKALTNGTGWSSSSALWRRPLPN